MSGGTGYEAPGIAGSGAIATGLAAVSTTTGDTILLARSEASAWRAEEKVVAACAKIEGAEPSRLRVTTDPADLADCDIVVEAIVEEVAPKGELLATVAEAVPERRPGDHHLLAEHRRDRRGGRHPRPALRPPRLQPGAADEAGRGLLPRRRRRAPARTALAWCAALGKTAVEVPDLAGFVVNRLLFPYLFDAVRFMEQTGMEAGEIDTCMKLGAGHPMGPLALLDFVGLDVCKAIGDALYAASERGLPEAPGAAGQDGRRREARPQERRRLLQLRLAD